MNGLQLIATGGALPGRTITNDALSRMVDTSDAWITSRTGIRTRHWCTEDESAATLAIAAARQALDRSGLAPADIACCVCATLSAPDATPSVACQVQAPARKPARTGHQRGLFRFSLWHGRGAGNADDSGRAICPRHRVRSTFPPDGPHRPLHLRAVRRRGRSRHFPAGRYPLCVDAGGTRQ